ncbi:phospholipid transfer protein-like [Girardinichthys multiradiatus]|uniref:phospholipid transfer protein-like n=1 Tax=Girardinichthys multiradiatus TaxID=208333 RepID=UPI001FAD8A63|nr:phospholipid transfer protein-like [Girardinichthys multiradiatus]XP_047215503.1 phospholipid transfer protein-like [Girardinichthys multiradiatus]
MASHKCSLLFFIFMFSSIRADDPAALKVRITNHAMNMLRDEAQAMFQEDMAGRTFEGFQFWSCNVSNVNLTEVSVNQAHLQFVENYGFQFMIKNFSFTLNFNSTNCSWLPAEVSITGLSATMEIGLTRNENRLAANMRTCQASIDRIRFVGTSLPRIIKAIVQWVLAPFVNNVFCPVLKVIGPLLVNRKLNTIPMVAELLPNYGIGFNYSLTRDVEVTTTSLDMSFKVQAYRQPQPPPMANGGMEPVFTEDALMAYVGISEFFFNSAARSLYEAGLMETNFTEINSTASKIILKFKQFFTQPWNLKQPLEAKVNITEVPSISITRDGVFFNMRPRVTVISPGTRTPNVFSLSAVCPISLMVTVEGNRLTLPSRDVRCRLVTSNAFKRFLVAPLNALLNNRAKAFLSGLFSNEVKIPVPEGVNFTQGNIRYEKGFVVVGGSLSFTPAGRQKLLNWG